MNVVRQPLLLKEKAPFEVLSTASGWGHSSWRDGRQVHIVIKGKRTFGKEGSRTNRRERKRRTLQLETKTVDKYHRDLKHKQEKNDFIAAADGGGDLAESVLGEGLKGTHQHADGK